MKLLANNKIKVFPSGNCIGKWFLVLLLFFGGIPTGLNAQVQLRIPDTTGTAGETFNIPVYVDDDLTGQEVYSYQIQLTFDANLLIVQNVMVTGTVSQPFGTPIFNTPSPGVITIAAAGASPLSGLGVFLYVQFQLLQSGYSALSFTDTIDNMLNEGVPSLNLTNGSININAAPFITVYPDNYLLTTGDSLQFYVSGGTAPYQWNVTNTTVSSIDADGLLIATARGFTRVIVSDSSGIIDTTNGFIEIRSLRLTIPDTFATQGYTIDIPVYTTSLDTLNITSGGLTLSYDPNIINATSVVTTNSLLATYNAPAVNTSNPGQVIIAFAGATPLTGSGVLLFVRFNVSSQNTGGTMISLSNAIFNQDILANGVDGYFTIQQLAALDIVPNTASMMVGDTLQFNVTGGTAPYTWAASDTNIASINASGLLLAINGGTITVMAEDSFGASGSTGNIQIFDTYISIPDTSVCSGLDTVDLLFYIGDLPIGLAVSSIQATIACQTPELMPVDIVATGTLTDGWSFTKNIISNQFIFAGAGSSGFNSQGVMVKLRFLLTSDLSVGENAFVTISDILLNEGSPLPQIINGSITRVDTTSLASVTIAADINPICAGMSVTFTAMPVNGGSSPSYQWLLNGNNTGTDSSVYTNSSLANGDSIQCIMTSSLSCETASPATSNSVTMIVNSTLAASVSIAVLPNDTICSGAGVTFTAIPTNGGPSPGYQWQINGSNVGTDSVNYTNSSLADGDSVQCIMTTSLGCATGSPDTSNKIKIAVNPNLAASVSISVSPDDTICSGAGVIFTAVPVNGGPAPGYQWQINGSNVGTDSAAYTNSSLTDGDIIQCIMTSSLDCTTGSPATSNNIKITVNPNLAAGVSISVSPNDTICSGTGVTFTAVPVNGGSTPTYQWQINGSNVGTGSAAYTNSSLADGDIIQCIMTTSLGCATGSPDTSNNIRMTVNPNLAAGVSISVSPNDTICSGAGVTFTATPTNGGSTPSYQWRLNGMNVGTGSSTYTNSSLAKGDSIQCVMTSSLDCTTGSPATSNQIKMTVNPSPVKPAISQSGNLLTCSSINVAYQWYFSDTAIVSAINKSHTAIKSGEYKVEVDSNGCKIMSDSINVEITGVNDLTGNSKISVNIYPNPFTATATVVITSADNFGKQGMRNLELKIYDLMGREVHQQSLPSKQETLNLNLPPEIYFYQVKSEKEMFAAGKLIIE